MSVRVPHDTVEFILTDPLHPFRRFHQLNARIAHPSNAVHRLDLASQMSQELRVVCEESWEEWYICLVSQIPLVSSRKEYLIAHQKYARRSLELEVGAFEEMGHLSPLPIPSSLSDPGTPTFQSLQEMSFGALEVLIQPLINICTLGSRPFSIPITAAELHQARNIGKAWWYVHTSIVLLTPEERERSSNYTRIPLGEARQALSMMEPTLIWNYLPPHLAARARHKRSQILAAILS